MILLTKGFFTHLIVKQKLQALLLVICKKKNPSLPTPEINIKALKLTQKTPRPASVAW